MSAELKTSHSERERIVEMVRKWGGPTCDAVLDPSMSFFEYPGAQGAISYRIRAGCAIVFGDPICPESDREALAEAFHRFANEKKLKVVYIWASRSYAHWAHGRVCGSIVECGLEYFFNNPADPRKISGHHGGLVRRKIHQAERDGVTVQEYTPHDPAIESGIEKVKDLWLEGRHGLQVHISNVYLFQDTHGKRWFYAKHGDQIIGVVVLNRLGQRNGWMLNHLMVIPNAPHGVSEFLIAAVFETLEKEGCAYATVGAVASTKVGEVRGMSAFSAAIARTLFRLAGKIIHLDRLNAYWGKYQPEFDPAYLMFSRNKVGIRELLGIKHAIDGTLKG